jgi:hypothetical protein
MEERRNYRLHFYIAWPGLFHGGILIFFIHNIPFVSYLIRLVQYVGNFRTKNGRMTGQEINRRKTN